VRSKTIRCLPIPQLIAQSTVLHTAQVMHHPNMLGICKVKIKQDDANEVPLKN
jgi:hypothetical protein